MGTSLYRRESSVVPAEGAIAMIVPTAQVMIENLSFDKIHVGNGIRLFNIGSLMRAVRYGAKCLRMNWNKGFHHTHANQ